MMKKVLALLLLVALAVPSALSPASADTRPAPEDRGASGLALALRRLQTIGSVLHTAAHPDDESTELLVYLARGEGARVAYLSLNRGEGGQNGIGPELGEGLGILRTEELLAARKLDGAEQYFTRAYDFGFTRSVEETLTKWDREEVLGDMVRVIRMMRPLVVVNGFSGTARDGHGQHQAAGMLTPEAVEAAADPARFPEQMKEGLQPWRVLKLYGRIFGQAQGPAAVIDTGRFDPILGRSYAELAAEGRSKHRSQDFGMIQPRGAQVRTFPRISSSVEVPARETSFFTGLDVSVAGIAGFAGAEGDKFGPALEVIRDAAAKAMSEFRSEDPARVAPHLAAGLRETRALRASIAGLDPVSRATVDGMLARKEWEFTDALVKAHGVVVDALSTVEIVTPGETVETTVNVYIGRKAGAKAEQIRLAAPSGWMTERMTGAPVEDAGAPQFMRMRETADSSARFRSRIPDDEPYTQPYWLVRERAREQFDWDASMPRNLPFAPPRVQAEVELTLAGERVTIRQPVEYRYSDKTFGEIRRELKVAPALALSVRPGLIVIPSGADRRMREVSVEITHGARQRTEGRVILEVPAGWKMEGNASPLAFTRQGERASRLFRVTAPAGAMGSFELRAVAEANGRRYTSGYTPIAYSHIETHFVYRAARARAELFDVRVAPGLRVGYVRGSGDDIPEALAQLGLAVREISEAELASGDLSVYDTIILGIRVYEVREDVVANNKRLLEYVAAGGTLIVQYNKLEFGRGDFAPYPVRMEGNQRVTDENARVRILAPGHAVFNFPNRITDRDWEGWVQERGLYFLSGWDERYVPLLSAPDESGRELQGGQLIAQYGKGNYVFTGYAWFRQLPAGVPGAYRLFANLVSLPKAKRDNGTNGNGRK
ncbi:MAG: PIG-L family deacetylase [Acidobacteria bacterium]|nr:PIG-L family deacetylase [Acidobacteriota bacterium]MCW5968327.1 PIG-L family deacetylase [Blastocatellales bacterium]